jgi:FtsZ-interacting cell division protein YlmF
LINEGIEYIRSHAGDEFTEDQIVDALQHTDYYPDEALDLLYDEQDRTAKAKQQGKQQPKKQQKKQPPKPNQQKQQQKQQPQQKKPPATTAPVVKKGNFKHFLIVARRICANRTALKFASQCYCCLIIKSIR